MDKCSTGHKAAGGCIGKEERRISKKIAAISCDLSLTDFWKDEPYWRKLTVVFRG